MSTKKTEHYGLHVWEPGDDFLREEFNANFGVIDGALGVKCEVVLGGYVGNKSNDFNYQVIELGFAPRMVMVWAMSGLPNVSGFSYMGVAMGPGGAPEAASQYSSNIRVLDNGFRIKSESNCSLNNSGTQYYFMAVR
ncbi:MAG: hypothetical protein HFF07_08045 [Oscillospiraceae bacterium]|nr:hypothetical protein [Oscillospiraceae bacterium]